MGKLFERGFEVRDGEVRPGLAHENEFRKRAFPKQKIGQALLAAGANQQIYFRRFAALDLGKHSYGTPHELLRKVEQQTRRPIAWAATNAREHIFARFHGRVS